MKHSFSYFSIIATVLMAVNSTYAMETKKKDPPKKRPINKGPTEQPIGSQLKLLFNNYLLKPTDQPIESQLKLLFNICVLLLNETSEIKSLPKSLDKSNKEKKFLEAKTKYYQVETNVLEKSATDNLFELLKNSLLSG